MPVQQLFDEAKRCGVQKLVLTEISNTASYIEMLRICQNNKPQDNGLTRCGTPAYTPTLPRLTRDKAEDAFDEIEMLGFCVCNPFKLLADPERGNALARNLSQDTGKQVRILGYVVVTKDTSAKTNHLMQFGNFLDCEGNVFDTVHFPDVTRRYPFRGRGFYDIRGKVVEDLGVPTIEASQMSKCSIVNPRAEQFIIETRELAPPSS